MEENVAREFAVEVRRRRPRPEVLCEVEEPAIELLEDYAGWLECRGTIRSGVTEILRDRGNRKKMGAWGFMYKQAQKPMP